MCKTSIRSLIFLFCSVIGCIVCTMIYTPGGRTIRANGLKSLETPTATAANASVTITQPGGSSSTVSGHPGTKVQIAGTGFQPGSSINIYTTSDTTQCMVANAPNLQAFTPRVVKANGNGSFQINPQWPASSGQQGTTYYICAFNAAAGTATVSTTAFTVAPEVTVESATPSANPGDKVTITGKNWLPAQQLAVSITSNQGANSIVSGQTVSNQLDGSFSIELTIPQGVQGGSYGVSVVAVNEQSLNTSRDNIITITAGSQATPTVTATPSPVATPTEEATATLAATPTAVASGGGGTNTPGSGIPPLTLLMFTLGALGIILVIVGLIMFVSYSRAG